MDVMDCVKKLKIDGWVYNPDVEDKLGSVYFDRNEDDYIRFSPVKNMDDTYVLTIVIGCQDREMFISTLIDDELNLKNTEIWIKKELKKYED